MTFGTLHIPTLPTKQRLSVPRRGHVLSSIAESFGAPIRAAVTAVAGGLRRRPSILPVETIASRAIGPQELIVTRGDAEMAAWHLCTQWLLGVVLGSVPNTATLIDAAQWFAGDLPGSLVVVASRLGSQDHEDALRNLRSIAEPEALADLFPYVLDPHGPGSRLSVMRDPATRATREKRRSHGAFYTPADVADHMARLALAHLPACHPVTVLDPACGTGVFLRAALAILRASHPSSDPLTLVEQSLFGVDIDPWAVDAAAYVLLHDVVAGAHTSALAPAIVWRLLRLNLSVTDALSIDPACTDGAVERAMSDDRARRQLLHAGTVPPFESTSVPLGRTAVNLLFPALRRGPHVVLGNPPYAALGSRSDLADLGVHFETLRPVAQTSDVDPLFVEQMVRLSATNASGALVIPLSVAFNSRPQHAAVRSLIARTPGTWRFSFFDREPHALFGEDVKTRNTIIAWSRDVDSIQARVLTGPLLKWRGDSRARLFESIHFTEVNGNISNGIPKLSGALQSHALARLQTGGSRLADMISSLSSSTLTEAFEGDTRTVFVASTAYNFINVLRKPPARLKPRAMASTNTIHALYCSKLAETRIVYAILSSRVTFWLWHVLGDGFHVTRAFVEDLPIGPALFRADAKEQLAALGQELWLQLRSRPITSNNRGRTTIAFSANREPALQEQIDQIVIRAAGLPNNFSDNLNTFFRSVIEAEPCGSSETSLQGIIA